MTSITSSPLWPVGARGAPPWGSSRAWALLVLRSGTWPPPAGRPGGAAVAGGSHAAPASARDPGTRIPAAVRCAAAASAQGAGLRSPAVSLPRSPSAVTGAWRRLGTPSPPAGSPQFLGLRTTAGATSAALLPAIRNRLIAPDQGAVRWHAECWSDERGNRRI
jgi:hypothetical protein